MKACGKMKPKAAMSASSSQNRELFAERSSLACCSLSASPPAAKRMRRTSTAAVTAEAAMGISPTKKPIRLSSAPQPTARARMMPSTVSPPQMQQAANRSVRCFSSSRAIAFSRLALACCSFSAGAMRCPRAISSQVTPYSSARAGSIEMSGLLTPVSQLLTVLLETPKSSAASACVYPFAFLRAARNPPTSVFVIVCSPLVVLRRTFYHMRDMFSRQKGRILLPSFRNLSENRAKPPKSGAAKRAKPPLRVSLQKTSVRAKQKRAPSLAEGRPLGRRCPESALIEQGEPDFPHTT